MDIVNFQQVFDEDNLQEDYELNSTFPPKAPYHLRHLIEFRLQLLLKENLSISPGETKLVVTACIITENYQDCQYISKILKSYLSYLSQKDMFITNTEEEFL